MYVHEFVQATLCAVLPALASWRCTRQQTPLALHLRGQRSYMWMYKQEKKKFIPIIIMYIHMCLFSVISVVFYIEIVPERISSVLVADVRAKIQVLWVTLFCSPALALVYLSSFVRSCCLE